MGRHVAEPSENLPQNWEQRTPQHRAVTPEERDRMQYGFPVTASDARALRAEDN